MKKLVHFLIFSFVFFFCLSCSNDNAPKETKCKLVVQNRVHDNQIPFTFQKRVAIVGNEVILPSEIKGYRLIANNDKGDDREFYSSSINFNNIALSEGIWNFTLYVQFDKDTEWFAASGSTIINSSTTTITLHAPTYNTQSNRQAIVKVDCEAVDTASFSYSDPYENPRNPSSVDLVGELHSIIQFEYKSGAVYFVYSDVNDDSSGMAQMFHTLSDNAKIDYYQYLCTDGSHNHSLSLERKSDSCGIWTEASCDDCGKTFICYEESKQKHTLDMTSPIIHLPGCTKQGYTEYRCSTCGRNIVDETSYVSNLGGHNLTDWVIPEATKCETTKETCTCLCTTCNETLIGKRWVTGLGHLWSEPKGGVVSCTEWEGLEELHCLRCNVTSQVKTSVKKSHSLIKDFELGCYRCTTCNQELCVGDIGLHGGTVLVDKGRYLDGWRYEEEAEGSPVRY